jgi:hypothetical protein
VADLGHGGSQANLPRIDRFACRVPVPWERPVTRCWTCCEPSPLPAARPGGLLFTTASNQSGSFHEGRPAHRLPRASPKPSPVGGDEHSGVQNTVLRSSQLSDFVQQPSMRNLESTALSIGQWGGSTRFGRDWTRGRPRKEGAAKTETPVVEG